MAFVTMKRCAQRRMGTGHKDTDINSCDLLLGNLEQFKYQIKWFCCSVAKLCLTFCDPMNCSWWDGWMASPTQWTWVWVSDRSWWWTGRPGVLQSTGLQRAGHDWATELNWTELQDARLPYPSLSPGVCSDSCLLSQWFHPTISSIAPFSFCPESFQSLGSFPMRQLFASGGQSIDSMRLTLKEVSMSS